MSKVFAAGSEPRAKSIAFSTNKRLCIDNVKRSLVELSLAKTITFETATSVASKAFPVSVFAVSRVSVASLRFFITTSISIVSCFVPCLEAFFKISEVTFLVPTS